VIIEGCAGIGVAGRISLSKEVLLVVAKKPSRSTKTSPQSPVTPEPKAKVRRRKAVAPAAAGVGSSAKANGAVWAPVAAPRLITDEDIRIRAYVLSMEHRGQGSPEYFWHLAERELRGGAR
jgi:hypothetical protein